MKSMKARFEGSEGKRLLIEELRKQRLVGGDPQLANEIASLGQLRQVEAGEEIIREGGADNHIFFILSGSVDTIVRGFRIARRAAGNSFGEIAAIQASEPRSATIRAIETSLLCVVTESQLNALGNSYPEIYRRLAQELARRLLEGNNLVSTSGDALNVLIVSAVEALPVARMIETAVEYDPFSIEIWKDETPLGAGDPLDSLDRALERADFAIMVAGSEKTGQNTAHSTAPRDTMICQLGFLMGKLGRHRTLLLEPSADAVALPADFAGVTILPYPVLDTGQLLAAIRPTCDQLRDYITRYGRRN